MTYVIGIDLGTTNCAVASVGLSSHPTERQLPDIGKIEIFQIPQLIESNQIEARPLLPSACFLGSVEGRERLPWENDQNRGNVQNIIIGAFASEFGSQIPTRQIISAKSWLTTSRGIKGEELLPIDGDVVRYTPRQALSSILDHIRQAWNYIRPEAPLEEQYVTVTIPASFNERARLEIASAIEKAGIARFDLLEEPVAALYAWTGIHNERFATEKSKLVAEDSILVIDVGGGTTDFALIHVEKSDEQSSSGALRLDRVAVGKHLILGGDNIDLFVQSLVQHKGNEGIAQIRKLKELAFDSSAPEIISCTIQKRGASVISGSKVYSKNKNLIQSAILEGFFPEVSLDVEIKKNQALSNHGLPYESDCRVTAHLAAFLRQAIEQEGARFPTKVLFNGGTLKPEPFRSRILQLLSFWNTTEEVSPYKITELKSQSLDYSVAKGAVISHCHKLGLGHALGKRINTGLAKTLYIKLDDGKLLTVLPRGSQAGTSFQVGKLFALRVNQPVSFPLFASQVRLHDKLGDIVEFQEDEVHEMSILVSSLTFGNIREKKDVQVALEARLSDIGTVEITLKGPKSWELEFETGNQTKSSVRHDYLLTQELKEEIKTKIHEAFKNPIALTGLLNDLQISTGQSKEQWSGAFLRAFSDNLLEIQNESSWRYWQLLGFSMRPGRGIPGDEWRIKEVWRKILRMPKTIEGDLQLHLLIAMRRISSGLTRGQQTQIYSQYILPIFAAAGRFIDPKKIGRSLYEEKLRLIASFEHLDIDIRSQVAEALCEKIESGDFLPVEFWAFVRLVSRLRLYAPKTTVLPRLKTQALVIRVLGQLFVSCNEKKLEAYKDLIGICLCPGGIPDVDFSFDVISASLATSIRTQIQSCIELIQQKDIQETMLGDVPVAGLRLGGETGE